MIIEKMKIQFQKLKEINEENKMMMLKTYVIKTLNETIDKLKNEKTVLTENPPIPTAKVEEDTDSNMDTDLKYQLETLHKLKLSGHQKTSPQSDPMLNRVEPVVAYNTSQARSKAQMHVCPVCNVN
jgi:hypothetical protein